MAGSTVVHDRGGFSEGLRWHRGALWFSDFIERFVYSLTEDGELVRRAFVPGQPSGLGFLPDGTPLVVSWYEQKVLRIGPGGALALHADLADVIVGGANDMVVDPRGRAYVGGIGRDRYAETDVFPGSHLALVDTDGSLRAGPGELVCPNGMALTKDGRRLVVAETFAHRLTVFDVAPDGALSGRRVFAELPGRGPDGICIDLDGAVWVACWSTGEFVRVREGGEVLDVVTLAPDRTAMCCVLGGADRRTLYCSIGDHEGIGRGEGGGRIHAVRVECPGFDVDPAS